MIPTTKFRYIERQDFTEDAANPRTIRILQQWWQVEDIAYAWHANVSDGEWRDVPLEKEE